MKTLRVTTKEISNFSIKTGLTWSRMFESDPLDAMTFIDLIISDCIPGSGIIAFVTGALPSIVMLPLIRQKI